MNKKLTKIVLISLAIFVPLISFAATKNSSEAIFVAADETITGNLMGAAESIIIDGAISGDLIVAASSVTVNGRIEGDVIAIAESIVINGEVGGNVRVLGSYVNINGLVARNINVLGSEVLIGDTTKVGWDVLVAANSANINGNIDGSIDAYVQKIVINSKVAKDVNVKILKDGGDNNLVLANQAFINGNLNYSASQALLLADNNIAGQINFNQKEISNQNTLLIWFWGRIFSVLSLIFIGLIFVFILRQETYNLLSIIEKKYLAAALTGVIVLLTTPVVVIILLFTIIGLPLSLILLGLWGAGILLAKTLAAIFLGDVIIRRLFKNKTSHLFWSLLIGAIIISLLFSLPWFGWLFKIITICIALGSILLYVTNKSKNI